MEIFVIFAGKILSHSKNQKSHREISIKGWFEVFGGEIRPINNTIFI
jgi:hypothetical protein